LQQTHDIQKEDRLHSYHSTKLHTRIIHTSTFHRTITHCDLSLWARWNYRCV